MRKPGDILPIYTDPTECTLSEGIATLREHIQSAGGLELWLVEFEDQPEHFYERWIKKEINGAEQT
jgi:hypothetical protein